MAHFAILLLATAVCAAGCIAPRESLDVAIIQANPSVTDETLVADLGETYQDLPAVVRNAVARSVAHAGSIEHANLSREESAQTRAVLDAAAISGKEVRYYRYPGGVFQLVSFVAD